MRAWRWLWVFAAVALTPIAAKATEIGFDAGGFLQKVDNDTRNVIGFGLPANEALGVFSVQSIRAGFPVSGSGEIQPALGISILSEEQYYGGRNTLAQTFLGLSYLQSFKASSRTGPYVRGGGDFRLLNVSYATPRRQVGLTGALGYRWRPGRVLGLRVEGGADRWFENSDLPGHWDFGLRVGISAYTD